jgi:hypothetical protein
MRKAVLAIFILLIGLSQWNLAVECRAKPGAPLETRISYPP